MKYKIRNLFFLISFILAFRIFYRPFIYNSNYTDLGFADFGSNLLAVPVMCVFLSLWRTYTLKEWSRNIVQATAVLVIFEVSSYYYPVLGSFDVKDVVALIVGSLVYVIIKLYRHEKAFIT